MLSMKPILQYDKLKSSDVSPFAWLDSPHGADDVRR